MQVRDNILNENKLTNMQLLILQEEFKRRYPLDKLWKDKDLQLESLGWLKLMIYLSQDDSKLNVSIKELHEQVTSIMSITK